ncbi:MAG: amino acid ABC transporter permease [Chloroflexota bacterium]|nr:amino acid ABC transporter permease [Chloroflexota bacterium]
MTARAEPLPPPVTSQGPAAWLRENLFNSWYNSIFTIVIGAGLAVFAVLAARWLVEARWGVLLVNMRLFLIGQYPLEQAWRIWLSLAILSLLAGASAAVGGAAVRSLAMWLAAGQVLVAALVLVADMPLGAAVALLANAGLVWLAYYAALRVPPPTRLLGAAWLLSIPLYGLLLAGVGGTPLVEVRSLLWGGLLLTFVLAISSIVLSFPLGVLLALGRRSDLPAIRIVCTVYIEAVRGVPLVSILFMAAVMLQLFLPGDLRIDALLRAIGGLTIFTAAYVAENVRGGLQAIPLGQLEAANAIGLNPLQRNLYIVLPQALRAVIPANVGLFISLLKDTTLVFVAGGGLLELLGIGRSVLAQSQFFGAHMEVYVFISAVFFIMCYAMSQASYRLEAAMGVGRR